MKKAWLVCLMLFCFIGLPSRARGQSFTIVLGSGSPASFSFSGVVGGASPASQTTVVVASPATSLPIVVAPDQSWLSASTDSTTTKATLTVSVSIAGLSPGSYSGNVVITATATNSPFKIPVALLVSAAANTPHSVSLTWTETATVSGFNVYRSTCATPQQKVSGASAGACSPAPVLLAPLSNPSATSYVDSTVLPGTSYEYYITAVGSTGVETGPSNTVVATIGPFAASGLKSTQQN